MMVVIVAVTMAVLGMVLLKVRRQRKARQAPSSN